MNNDDKSYERYKQYRLNKYRYEQEQILFPIYILIGLAILISLWKYILIGIAVVAALTVVMLIVWRYMKKQVIVSSPIIITEEEANDGVEAIIRLTYNQSKVTLNLDIPPKVNDGQKFVVKNVLFKNEKGKKVKKRVHFKIKIL